jgi:glucokinase
MSPARRVGIDVGGTKCLGVVLDASGETVGEWRRPTPQHPDALVDTLVEMVRDMAPSDAIGVGVPGLVTRTGTLRAAPHLPDVGDLELGPLLSARLGTDVYVDNDATCAAAAEWRLGAGVGSNDLIMVTLGTGIGGGVVAGGHLVRGAHGFTGEMGHMVVDPAGPPCPCGRRGCWERYASGTGLARLAREAAEVRRLQRVVELAGGSPDDVRGEDVCIAAAEGDDEALAVVDEFARWVAIGLVNLTNLLDPDRFVLGGGLAESSELYIEPIRRWFVELLYAPHLRPHPDLVFARFGPYAGAVGAAVLAGER